MMEPMAKLIGTLNIEDLTSRAFGLSFDLGSKIPNSTMSATQARKTHPIRFINGSEGIVYFSNAESGILITVAASAPLELARFQKNPIKNIASIPGVMKPVNSWI